MLNFRTISKALPRLNFSSPLAFAFLFPEKVPLHYENYEVSQLLTAFCSRHFCLKTWFLDFGYLFLWMLYHHHVVWTASFRLFAIFFIVFVIYSAGSSICLLFVFFRVGVFTGALRFTITYRCADDPVLGGRKTAVSAVPPAVFVVVNWITHPISDFCFPATGYALQIGGVWVPVKLLSPSARDDHAPLVLISL